ncbi:MAG: hypothetical protein BWK78_01905 [Thiotrichaceae bacterium IS1]|nr:MAG: hypothetical protein BWK78_01905 [Thiotrichaceae bacterium IS1]
MRLVKLWVLVLGLGWGLVCWGEQGAGVDPGEEYFQRGEFELAVGAWEEARLKLDPEKSPADYVDLSVNLAAAYQSLGRLREARNVLLCVEPCIPKNDSLRRAAVKSQLGDVYLVMGDSRPDNVQDDMMDNKIPCPINFCDVETITPPKPENNVVQACNYLEDALKENLVDKPLLRANILNKQGNVLVAQKKYEEALKKYKESVTLANQENDKALAINASLNGVQTTIDILWAYRKNVCFFRQIAEDVIEANEASVNIIDDIKDSKIADKLEKSLQEMQQAFNVDGNNTPFVNILQQGIKTLKGSIGESDLDKIINSTQAVLNLLKEDGPKTVFQQQVQKFLVTQLATILKQVQATNELKPYDKAFALMSVERLVQMLQALSTKKAQSCPLPSRLEVLKSLRLEQTQKLPVCSLSPLTQEEQLRFNALKEAAEVAKITKNSNIQAYVGGYLAQLYAERRCYEQAIQLTRRAIDSVKSYLPLNTEDFEKLWGYPDQLYRWEWQLAIFLKEQGQTPLKEVMVVYDRAEKYLQSVRDHYRSLPQPFLEDAIQFYFEWADLLLQVADKEADLIKKTGLLKKAIKGIESFKESELRNYFKDDCSVGTYKEHLKGVDRILPAKTAIFYPMMFDDRVELLLSFANSERSDNIIKQIKSPVVPKVLRQAAETLRKKMKPGYPTLKANDDPDLKVSREYVKYFPHANKLDEGLIQPVLSILHENGINTLIIIPDKFLRSTPFATLCKNCGENDKDNADRKKFLFQRYVLVIAPGWELTDHGQPQREKDWSLTLLNGLKNPKSTSCSSPPLVANHCTTGDVTTTLDFGELPNVTEELNNLQTLLGVEDENKLEEDKFKRHSVEDKLSKTAFFMVHFATHGYFDEDKDTSFLLACDGQLTLDHLQTLFESPVVQENPVELLFLSACQSALGKEPQAALGLAGIAVKAGVRSAVGTLWQVSSGESTRLLVEEFYGKYKGGKVSKAEALQQAQQSLITKESFYDPFFWAPFVLIGNWQ